MYQVKFTTTFKKSYKLMKKRGLDLSLLDEVVDLLRQGKQLDEKYRDHILIFLKIETPKKQADCMRKLTI